MSRVLITGVSRGIGNSIATQLLQHGYEVVGTSREPSSIKITDEAFAAVQLDLEKIAKDTRALKRFVEHCGQIDVLILNAGSGRFGGLEQFSHSQIEQMLSINLVAQIQIVRAFIPMFKNRGSGDFIFIGSESAVTAGKQGTIYSASKFGLRGFSQALRCECANNNIRVGLINPGMVNSHFFDELGFEPGPDAANSLLPDQITQVVMMMLNSADNVVFDEINLSPLKKVIIKKKTPDLN